MALLFLFGAATIASAQPTSRQIVLARSVPRQENFYVIEKRRNAEFEALRKARGADALEEEGSGYGAYKVWENYWAQKLAPSGDFNVAVKAMSRVTRDPLPAASRSGTCHLWNELGPLDTPAGQPGLGRINWLAFDPANANNVFVGSPKGGLYSSTDAGDHWQSGGTDFLLPNIGAAHIAVDPTNADRWFLASGDGDGLNDGQNNNGWNISHGVYRTSDRGVTWDQIGLDFSLSNPWDFQIKRVLIDPSNPNVVYAATSIGLYRTSNALAPNPANVSWVLQGSAGPYYDVAFQPGSTTTIYASGVTVLRSTNGGGSWSQIPGIPFLGADVLRIAMAVTPANPNFLYTVVIEKGPAACNSNVNSARLYRFDANSGAWTDKGPICNTGSYSSDQAGVHSSRGHSIGVSPIDPKLIYLADVSPVVKCTTGDDALFCNWTGTTSTVHSDIHQVVFTPDGQSLYATSDGGVFKSGDGGATWIPKNNGLSVATSERMSTSATDPSLMLNGLFDNGTLLRRNGLWTHVVGGDGLTPIIDHIDPNHMYASYQGGGMYRSDNMGTSFPYYIGPPCANWFTNAILNSANPMTVFAACMPEVVRSTTRGGSWTAISTFAAQGMGSFQVWKLYTAPSNPDYLYATLVNSTSQVIMLTKNANDPPANVVWQQITHPSQQWITDIDVDEANPDVFYLTYGGLSPATDKVYRYDGAGNWLNLTADLATSNLGVNDIVHQRGSTRLFIGTTIGVYTADAAAPSWTRVGAATPGDLPYVEANDLEINYVANLLRVSTFGRGVWETALDPCLPAVVGPDALIKDSDADLGNQPDVETGTVLWASPDIWVRNAPDHEFTYSPIPPRYSSEHQHQNPEYSPNPSNTPYIYAMVHNRGDQPVSGHVHLYWANASTGLDWPGDWTEIPTSTNTDVASLAPGGEWVVQAQWTDIPAPALSTGGHFCLLARFVADSSTPDPIVGEVSGNGVWGNVLNSNNIAWKNVTVVDNVVNFHGGGNGGQVFLRNIHRRPQAIRVSFDLAPGSESYLGSGPYSVDLGRELFTLWQRSGAKGMGVKVSGKTALLIQQPHAYIDFGQLAPREAHVMTFRFPLPPGRRKVGAVTLNVSQLDLSEDAKAAPRIVGGETFQVWPLAHRRITPRPQG